MVKLVLVREALDFVTIVYWFGKYIHGFDEFVLCWVLILKCV